jgi:hypothetical protein
MYHISEITMRQVLGAKDLERDWVISRYSDRDPSHPGKEPEPRYQMQVDHDGHQSSPAPSRNCSTALTSYSRQSGTMPHDHGYSGLGR